MLNPSHGTFFAKIGQAASNGIVQWQNCVESGAHVEAIAVASSHCGIPFHSETLAIILDRLARRSERSHVVTAHSALPKHRFQRIRASLATIKHLGQVE